MPVLNVRMRAWLLCCVVFLAMIGYLPDIMSSSTAGRWAVTTVVGLPLFLTWGIPRWSLGSFLALLLFAWVGIGLTWSEVPWDTLGSILHWSALFGLGLAASRLEDRSQVWIAAALGVSISLPFVLLQVAGYSPVWSLVRAGYLGNVGLFLTTNVIAEVSTVAFVLMLFQPRWLRLLAIAPGICAALSGRSEVLLMLATVGLIYWPTTRRYFVAIALGAALLFVVLAHYSLIGPSMTIRLQVWSLIINNIDAWGAGLGTFATIFTGINFAHNELLQLIFELGIGATLAVGLVACALFNESSHNFPDKLALWALLASSTVWAPLQDPATALLVSLLVGGLLGDRYRASWVTAVKRGRNLRRSPRPYVFASEEIREATPNHSFLATRPQSTLGARTMASDV